MNRELYDDAFFVSIRETARQSAEVIVPFVSQLIRPTSVVDLGCGSGEWLAAFERYGATYVLGIDGAAAGPVVRRLRSGHFAVYDLSCGVPLRRTFDLAVCLEVGEHLPVEAAAGLVSSLCALAPAVLFSAAVPHQGGVHHVSERWPGYWMELFAYCGFVSLDIIRPHVWEHSKVAWWYAQNTLLYVNEEKLGAHAMARLRFATTWPPGLSLIHPQNFQRRVAEVPEPGVRGAVAHLVKAVGHASRRRSRRLRLLWRHA